MKVLKIFEKILRNRNYAEKTIDNYISNVKEFLLIINIRDYHQLTLKILNDYLINYNYSSISKQNQVISSLKKFFELILNKKEIHLSKIKRPKKEKKLPKAIDKKELQFSISQINNLKHKAIISLAYSVGLRVSEVINLKIEDIDSERMLIHIKNSKGKKDRFVPLSKNILYILRKYYKQYKPKIYLFNGQKKQTYSYASCNKIVKKYLDKRYHFHLLRHSCFTSLLENGTDIRIIQKIAGHSSIKTTEIYTHVSNNVLKNVKLPL
jgi:integrase/recombinase XerD